MRTQDSVHTVKMSCTGTAIPADNVYFTFADRRFAYDCATCGAACCRGHGYTVAGHEMDTLLEASPLLGFFSDDGDTPDGFTVSNCPPACFFLGADGHCRIHARYGYTAKPETCRLFPFNNFRRLSEYLVVMPHAGLCPLRVASDSDRSVLSGHMQLTEELTRYGIASVDVPEVMVRGISPAEAIYLERRIVGLSEKCVTSGNYEQFVLDQLVAHRDAGLSDRQHVPQPTPEELTSFVHSLHEILGVPLRGECVNEFRMVRTLAACTPTLRSMNIFYRRSRSGKVVPRVAPHRLPYLLLALRSLLALAAEAGMADITYQTIMRVMQMHAPLLCLLAHADCAVAWARDSHLPFALAKRRSTSELQAVYVRIAKDLLYSAQRHFPKSLSEVLCTHLPQSTADRWHMLRALSTTTAGQIVPIDQYWEHLERRVPVKRRLEHWLWASLDPPALRQLGQRQRIREMRRSRRSSGRQARQPVT